MLKDRIYKLRQFLAGNNLDAVLLSAMPSIRYFSGFTGSDALMIVSSEQAFLGVDSRYVTQASDESSEIEIICYRNKFSDTAEQLALIDPVKAAFEGDSLAVNQLSLLKEKTGEIDLVSLKNEISKLRCCKDAGEIKLLKKVAAIASESFMQLVDTIEIECSESEFARMLEFTMRENGADSIGFDIITASGLRGALPHGRASEKFISRGELVTVDFGCVKDGYHSDETVTFSIGNPDEKQLEIYSIVKRAHDLAVEAVAPGVRLKDIDKAARDYITSFGYGDNFGHGLGHGVGLEIHEFPTLNTRSEDVAMSGMVFTIEPGIYIPGWGGVRIEDTVVVTESGCEIITGVPKELMIL